MSKKLTSNEGFLIYWVLVKYFLQNHSIVYYCCRIYSGITCECMIRQRLTSRLLL